MALFFSYLKSCAKVIGVCLLFCLVFLVIFALYHLPLTYIVYPALLCAFLGLSLLLTDFYFYRRRHLALVQAAAEISVSLAALPLARDLRDQDYRRIIAALYEEKQRLDDDMRHRYTDLFDYYTIWAHQIKTPIAAMDLLVQSSDFPEKREFKEELNAVGRYVEMALYYLRLEDHAGDYVLKEQPLEDIVKKAVRGFAPQFIRRRLTLDYKPLSMTVLTDEKWLRFVIEQVLSNALKYTHAGKITIAQEGDFVLRISDTGIGIGSEDLPRVFEKGFTGKNGRENHKASGIGLYLCRRILTNLGHRITMESEIGRGTTVRIDLKQQRPEVE